MKNKKLSFLNFSLGWLILLKFPYLARKLFYININERLCDYAFVHQNIGSNENCKKILDVGCYGNKLVIELASLGYEVYGIDPTEFSLEHPNFIFIQGDICQSPFPNDYFDVVTAVSTIEHIGLGRWDDPAYSEGDKRAMIEIKRILKPGGKAIITVPFGRKKIVYHHKIPLHRIYDFQALNDLFFGLGLKIIKTRYIVKKDDMWVQVTMEEAENVDSGEVLMADALIIAQKEML